MFNIFLILGFVGGVLSQNDCGPNEVLKECGTACEKTCNTTETQVCTDQCLVNVCQCDEGFVRHEGKCIFPFLCPKECRQNEELLQCGTACEPSCEVPEPVICTLQCLINVCQCSQGYVRNAEGNCVNVSECPAKPATLAPTNSESNEEDD